MVAADTTPVATIAHPMPIDSGHIPKALLT
jgi:hypothetical protein